MSRRFPWSEPSTHRQPEYTYTKLQNMLELLDGKKVPDVYKVAALAYILGIGTSRIKGEIQQGRHKELWAYLRKKLNKLK